MRLPLVLAVLVVTVAPAMAPAEAQVAPACGTNQNCPPGSTQVPFPVVNPVQSLANVLNLQRNNNQPPQQPLSANGLAPIATPPPVLPPGTSP